MGSTRGFSRPSPGRTRGSAPTDHLVGADPRVRPGRFGPASGYVSGWRMGVLFPLATARLRLLVLVGAPLALADDPPPIRDDEATPTPTATAQPKVRPVEIKIPALQVDADIVPVGEDPDGAMTAPSDPDTAAWWMLGPGTG